MNKLRLDFLKSLGGKVAVGDVISRLSSTDLDASELVSQKYIDLLNAPDIENNNVIMGDNDVLIESFAPRANTGEQPMPDGVPVLVALSKSPGCNGKTLPCKRWQWPIKSDITEWMPCIDALIIMQDEHDKAIPTAPTFSSALDKDKADFTKLVADPLGLGQAYWDVLNSRSDFTFSTEVIKDKRKIAELFRLDQEAEDLAKHEGEIEQLSSVVSRLSKGGYFVPDETLKFMQDSGLLSDVKSK